MFDSNEERILKLVFKKYNDKLCEILPTNEETNSITFTKRFERKAKRILFHHDKFYYSLINTFSKRVACFIVTLIILFTATTLSVKAFREPFIQFVVETFEKFSDLFFKNETSDETIYTDLVPMTPQYIPQGFKLVSNSETENQVQQIYEDNNGNSMIYTQFFSDNSVLSVDTEGVDYKKAIINNKYEALIYENKNHIHLTFTANEYVFSFLISNQYSEDQLIMVAESLLNL